MHYSNQIPKKINYDHFSKYIKFDDLDIKNTEKGWQFTFEKIYIIFVSLAITEVSFKTYVVMPTELEILNIKYFDSNMSMVSQKFISKQILLTGYLTICLKVIFTRIDK